MILDILLTFFLVFLNGFFVAAEFAIVKVRLSQIELKVKEGSKLAKLSSNIVHHLDAYLSATQLGITIASLALGWIGEPVVSAIIINLMDMFGFSITPEMAHKIALPVAFVTITILHIVFGELAPKSLAIQRSEQVTLLVSIPLRIFYLLFSPFIWLLNSFANLMLRLAGFPAVSELDQLHSSDEIRYILDESKKSGIIEAADYNLINKIFDFSNKDIKQIMVPRGKIVGIDSSLSFDEIVQVFINEGYTRMPVYTQDIDNIIGTLNAKELFPALLKQGKKTINEMLRQAYFVQENDMLKQVLNNMLKNKVHIAFVLDEFGGIAGMVTMEDIIEEIIGEIQDEYDDEKPLINKITDNEYIISARTVINDLNEILPVPLPESEEYETVGGMIMCNVGRIPELNEELELEHYKVIILQRSNRLIELVKIIQKMDNSNEDNLEHEK